MSLHVIVGAGLVGTGVAKLLAERGERVRLIESARVGSGTPVESSRVAADATKAESAFRVGNGSRRPLQLLKPALPSVAHGLAAACGCPPCGLPSGAAGVLAVAGGLDGYGRQSMGRLPDATPLAAKHPKLRLRADMWREALARHQAGRIRVTEIQSEPTTSKPIPSSVWCSASPYWRASASSFRGSRCPA